MLILLALLTAGQEPVFLSDTVDVIEFNRFHDEQGRHVFDQLIFWDWNKYECRFDIRDWRLVKDRTQPPVGNEAWWHDGQTIRRVTAVRTYTSWSQHDPELVERGILPKEQRRGLTPVISAKRAKELYKER